MQSINLDALTRTYTEDGFVELRGYLEGAELEEFRSRTLAVMAHLREHAPVSPDAKFAEIRKNLHKHDPWALDHLHRGRQVPVIERLVGDTLVPATFAWFEKRPGRQDDLVGPHFDAVGRFPALGATMWIALDPVSRQSGCLHYLRGSHKRDFPSRVDLDVSGYEDDDLPMEAEPGDAFIHSARTIHWSDHNETNTPRRAVALFYWGKEAAEANDRAKRGKAAGKKYLLA